MNKKIPSLLLAASLLAAPLISFSGCSSTGTRQSTGEFVDDTAITAKVKTELIRDPVVKARQVEVETFKGTVQLSGFVDTEEQRLRAAEVARTISGVHDVRNNITVKAETTR
jgi:hyperosmotically inducible periplasmic protein